MNMAVADVETTGMSHKQQEDNIGSMLLNILITFVDDDIPILKKTDEIANAVKRTRRSIKSLKRSDMRKKRKKKRRKKIRGIQRPHDPDWTILVIPTSTTHLTTSTSNPNFNGARKRRRIEKQGSMHQK
jgi:hypothetical protein